MIDKTMIPIGALANSASPNMSEKYGFVSSLEVAEFLDSQGWNLISGAQRNSRTAGPTYLAHWMRFRKPTSTMKDREVGDLYPEIYFRNSHNGSTGILFEAGLFRLTCLNGAIVKDASFMNLRLRHAMKNVQDLKPAIDEFVLGFDKVYDKVKTMKDITLDLPEQLEFASKSAKLLWGQNTPIIEPQDMLQARRREDEGSDLWKVYNRVQENLSKGGLSGISSTVNKNGEQRKIKTKGLKDTFRYVSFNSKLWELTEELMNEKVSS